MKIKRILAVALIVAALLFPSCAGGDGEMTTAPETSAVTTAPITENTTEAPPPAPDELLVLRDAAATDRVIDGGRAELLAKDYGIRITERDDIDIVKTVRTAVLAGKSDDCGALLLTTKSAVELFCEGHLQNLSVAGIEADAHLPSDDVSRALSFGGGVYMLYSNALSSKFTSAYGVLYRADTLEEELAKLVLDGDFTLEIAMNMAKGADSSLSANIEAKGISFIYRGLGGKLFDVGEGGLPTLAFGSDADAAAYRALLGSSASITAEGGMFTVTRLSAAEKGEFYLPMPKANSAQAAYVTPIDTDAASVLALPYGITSGALAKRAFEALSVLSADAPAKMAAALAPAEGDARTIAEKIVTSLSIEPSLVYGWGDMSEFLFENLVWRVDIDTVLADKSLADRREAVDIAASIIKSRIEK